MSRKQEIIARIITLMEAMKVSGDVRVVERKKDITFLEQRRPAIHVVVGPETNQRDEENNRGYTVEFGVDIKVMTDSASDAEDKADGLAAKVQTAIEGDLQLILLCVQILYDGDEPFLNEAMKPEGGIVIGYTVFYRRERGRPEIGF
jgi:hypothetical protein